MRLGAGRVAVTARTCRARRNVPSERPALRGVLAALAARAERPSPVPDAWEPLRAPPTGTQLPMGRRWSRAARADRQSVTEAALARMLRS